MECNEIILSFVILLASGFFWGYDRRERKKQRSFEAVSVVHKDDIFKKYRNYNEARKLLNYFEHISVLIQYKHIDELIVKKMFKTKFISTYYTYKQQIEKERGKNPRVYINYFKQVEKWETEDSKT
ncbi:MAG: hypothetical protein MPJ25_14180 [Pirellulales bacterium]|nr:hypothetical protein [Pirellulales bacterium]